MNYIKSSHSLSHTPTEISAALTPTPPPLSPSESLVKTLDASTQTLWLQTSFDPLTLEDLASLLLPLSQDTIFFILSHLSSSCLPSSHLLCIARDYLLALQDHPDLPLEIKEKTWQSLTNLPSAKERNSLAMRIREVSPATPEEIEPLLSTPLELSPLDAKRWKILELPHIPFLLPANILSLQTALLASPAPHKCYPTPTTYVDLTHHTLYTNPLPHILSSLEFHRICDYVSTQRQKKQREVALFHRSLYLPARETGLPRALHFSTNSVWIHFNKKRLGDTTLGEGSSKTITYAYNLENTQVRASAGLSQFSPKEVEIHKLLQKEHIAIPLQEELEYHHKKTGIKHRLLLEKADTNLASPLFPLSETQKQSITQQLLHHVSWMHTHNQLHRDLKPENILLLYASPKTPESAIQVYLGDFGDSCYQNDTQAKQLPTGTESYLPPEYLAIARKALSSSQPHTFSLELANLTNTSLDTYALGLTLCFLWELEPNLVTQEAENSLLGLMIGQDPSKRPPLDALLAIVQETFLPLQETIDKIHKKMKAIK